MSRPSSTTCLENIGPRERRKRLVGGVVTLVLGLGVAVLSWGTDFWWRPAPLFLIFWGGALGIFQALDHT